MASNSDPRSLGYLLSKIRADPVLQIQVLATLGAAVLGVQALLGSRRRRCSSKFFLILLWAAYTVSGSLVSYTVGRVQSFNERDQSSNQLWWAVGLLLLLGSSNTMSAFTRHDAEQSKGMQAQHILQTLLVLWLLVSRANKEILPDKEPKKYHRGIKWDWTITLFVCWLYSIIKMFQRIKALRMASSSHGLVRGAMVVADYMQDEIERFEPSRPYDPVHMTGYRYLVDGEEEHSVPPSDPIYRTRVPVEEVGKVVTIDKIWGCRGELLRSEDNRARALKDACLSFALFKLLKRRFCELEVAEAGQKKAKDLVLHGLLADDDYERAFRVVELELSFLHDFFYTMYPAIFRTSRVLQIARYVFLLAFIKLFHFSYVGLRTALSIFKVLSSLFMFLIFSDFFFIFVLLAIEVMQQLSTGYSNWAVVHFVCGYVRREEAQEATGIRRKRWWHTGIRQALIKRLAARRARTSTHWENKLGQYSLLESFDYHPSIFNGLSLLTGRLLEKTREGRKRSPAVKLRGEVKKAVLRSLKQSEGVLTNGISSVKRNGRLAADHSDQLLWACSLPTHTQTVLVWHIATTLCDQEEAAPAAGSEKHRCSWISASTVLCGHCNQVATGADSEEHRRIATSLSRYCAYLLAFYPEMLPDHSYKATQVLDAVVQEARKELGDTKGMPDKCKKMLLRRGDSIGILVTGARLWSQLMDIGCEERWKLLADLWAELVLFLAPSDNADVHADGLTRGGEFMTHLWALLTNAGIIDRDPAAATHV